MRELNYLFHNNRRWADDLRCQNPDFFRALAAQQSPKFLWIGCSDSRVPANDIVGLMPGELFVHRNVANLVIHSDLNALSVIQFAVEVLKVEHIIVCGHYGCGGVRAAMEHHELGLIDNWLCHIRDIHHKHRFELSHIKEEKQRLDRLCELNVLEQLNHVCQTSIVQNAWQRKQALSVHGWIYAIEDGHLHDLHMSINNQQQIDTLYQLFLPKRAEEMAESMPHWVLGLLAFTVYLFVSEMVRVDVAAILVMVLLGLTTVLPFVPPLVETDRLFDGFASNAVISIIAVMIIGAGLDKTGLMSKVASFILRVGGSTESASSRLISGTVGVSSPASCRTSARRRCSSRCQPHLHAAPACRCRAC
jgi:carbonic anhydrase